MQNASLNRIRLFAFFVLTSLASYTALVLFFYFGSSGFHGFLADMRRTVILELRTALAGLAIFNFVPMIWILQRRGNEGNENETRKQNIYAILLLLLAEMPALYGLILFLLKGAFKTYFAFLALSVLYLLIAWPRNT